MGCLPAGLIPLITAAINDPRKLPAALVFCGISLIASAVALIISKSPGDVLVTWHGRAATITYYTVLVATVALGLVEAAFGFWVVSRLQRWSLTAKVLLFVSLVALAVVIAPWAGMRL